MNDVCMIGRLSELFGLGRGLKDHIFRCRSRGQTFGLCLNLEATISVRDGLGGNILFSVTLSLG